MNHTASSLGFSVCLTIKCKRLRYKTAYQVEWPYSPTVNDLSSTN